MKKRETIVEQIEEIFKFFAERKMQYQIEGNPRSYKIIIQIPLMNAYKFKLMKADIRAMVKEESFYFKVKHVHDKIVVTYQDK